VSQKRLNNLSVHLLPCPEIEVSEVCNAMVRISETDYQIYTSWQYQNGLLRLCWRYFV